MKQVTVIVTELKPDNTISFNVVIQNGKKQHSSHVSMPNPAGATFAQRLQSYFNPRQIDEVHIHAIEYTIQNLGKHLFTSLFHNTETAAHWRKLEADLKLCNFQVIELPETESHIPWYLLYNTTSKKLLIEQVANFTVHYGKEAESNRQIESRLNALIVTARPGGINDVPFRSIANLLFRTYSSIPGLELTFLRQPTFEHFSQVLEESQKNGNPFQLVHFDGHGVYENGKSSLVFENAYGDQPVYIGANELGPVIENGGVRLFVMNACKSDFTPAELSFTTEAGSSVTLLKELARYNIDAVLGMKYDLEVRSAQYFIKEFYKKIFTGYHIQAAFRYGLIAIKKEQVYDQPARQYDLIIPTLVLKTNLRFSFSRPGLLRKIKFFIDDIKGIHDKQLSLVLDDLVLQVDRAFQHTNIVHLYGCLGSGRTELSKLFGKWALHTGLCKNVIYVTKKEYAIYESFKALKAGKGVKDTDLLVLDETDKARPMFRKEETLMNMAQNKILLISTSADFHPLFTDVFKLQATLDTVSAIAIIEYVKQRKDLLKLIDLKFLVKKSRGNLLTCHLYRNVLNIYFKKNIVPGNLYDLIDFDIKGFTFPKNELTQFRNWFTPDELIILTYLHIVGSWFTLQLADAIVKDKTSPVNAKDLIVKLRNLGLIIDHLHGHAMQLHPYIIPHLRSDFEKLEFSKQNQLLHLLNNLFFETPAATEPLMKKAVSENAAYIARCAIRQKYKPALFKYLKECRRNFILSDEEWVNLVTKAYNLCCTTKIENKEKQHQLEAAIQTKVGISLYFAELSYYRLELENAFKPIDNLEDVFDLLITDFETNTVFSDSTVRLWLDLLFLYSKIIQDIIPLLKETENDNKVLIAFLVKNFTAFLQRAKNKGLTSILGNKAYWDKININITNLRSLHFIEFKQWFIKVSLKKDLLHFEKPELQKELSEYFNSFPEFFPKDNSSITNLYLGMLSMVNDEGLMKAMIKEATSLSTLEMILGKDCKEEIETIIAYHGDALSATQHEPEVTRSAVQLLKAIKVKLFFWVLKSEDLKLLFDQAIVLSPDLLLFFINIRIEEQQALPDNEKKDTLAYFESLYNSIEERFKGIIKDDKDPDSTIKVMQELCLKGKMEKAFGLYEHNCMALESRGEFMQLFFFKIDFLSFSYILSDMIAELPPYGTLVMHYIKSEIEFLFKRLIPNFTGDNTEITEKFKKYTKDHLLKKICIDNITKLYDSINKQEAILQKLSDIGHRLRLAVKGSNSGTPGTHQIWEFITELSKMRNGIGAGIWLHNKGLQKDIYDIEALLLDGYVYSIGAETGTIDLKEYIEVIRYFNVMLKNDKYVRATLFVNEDEVPQPTTNLNEKVQALNIGLAINLQFYFLNSDFSNAIYIIEGIDTLIDFFKGNKMEITDLPDDYAEINNWDMAFLISKKTMHLLYLLNHSLSIPVSAENASLAWKCIKTIETMYPQEEADKLRLSKSTRITFYEYKTFWYYHLILNINPDILNNLSMNDLQKIVNVLRYELSISASIIFESKEINKAVLMQHLHKMEYLKKEATKKLTEQTKKILNITHDNYSEKIFE